MEFEDLYELVIEYQRTHDKKTLEVILNFFGEFVYKIAEDTKNDYLQFEDIIQICFEAIIKVVNTYNFNKWDKEYFLPRITDAICNALTDEMKESQSFYDSYIDEDEYVEDDTLDNAIDNIKIDFLGNFINSLPDVERLILLHTFIAEKLNDYELAKMSGLESRHIRDRRKIVINKIKSPVLRKRFQMYIEE